MDPGAGGPDSDVYPLVTLLLLLFMLRFPCVQSVDDLSLYLPCLCEG